MAAPRDLQQPAAAPAKDEDQSPWPHRIGVLLFLLLGSGTVALVVAHGGPTALLRAVLRLFPEKPGWSWYIALGLIITAGIVCAVPVWPPLCMVAGLIFGFWWGAPLNFCAIISGAACSIVLGSLVLRGPVRRWMEDGRYPMVRRAMLVLEDSEDSFCLLVLFRFLFIPMPMRNYGPSALNIPVGTLILAAIPHSLWASIMFASLGSTFQDTAAIVRDGGEFTIASLKWQQALVFSVSACVAVVFTVYAYRRFSALAPPLVGPLAEGAAGARVEGAKV